jgi:hypothetical protein
MSAKERELVVLAAVSAIVCGTAWAVDDVFATSIFGYLTCGILLPFVAIRTLSKDAQ